MSELYIRALQRILDVRSDFDQARELEAANHPRWKKALRAARFTCKDEGKLLRLVDRATRGMCDCLGMKTRISFETAAEINARRYQKTPEDLRRQQTRDLITITILKKAILYHLTLPEEFLRDGVEDELNAYVEDKIAKPG